MGEVVLAGASIGYVALVLVKELELIPCRLCLVFWLSVAYAAITVDPLSIGLVNLVAHLSFIALTKVAYDDPKISDPALRPEETEARVRGE